MPRQVLPYWLPKKDRRSLAVFAEEEGKRDVTELDIGDFFIRGEAREVEGEFQAVIVMRAKPPLTAITCHQVEKDRWFKTPEVAAQAAREAAKALKRAIDEGALKA